MLFFLLYNDNDKYIDYIEKLRQSIIDYGNNVKIIIFEKKDIDSAFMEKNNDILTEPTGGGYWLWKPYIINETLMKLEENDILFYLDSNYYFTEDFTDLYSHFMLKNDILVWKNKPNEPVWFMKNWCKMDVILKYNMYEKVFVENVEDCWAGALVLKKNENTIGFIKEWLTMCCIYENITNSPSQNEDDLVFYEHRHDQSLLSILLHKYNINIQYFPTKYLQNGRCPY